MNTFELGCAVLSSATYRDGRKEANWTPPAPGAVKLDYVVDKSTGFEATAYQYQGRVVIAYAGTDPSDKHDLAADAILGFGLTQAQMNQAADFYERVKANNGANITFTGHSLGGGLAALMGVFFNKEAVTFDPAPFRVAASLSNAQALQRYLTTATATRLAYAPDTDLASYTTTEQSLATAQPALFAALAAVALGTAVLPLGQWISAALAGFLLTRPYLDLTRRRFAANPASRPSPSVASS